jgi:signal transduction histidine kinase
VVSAVRDLCRELAKQHGANIEFKDENVPKPLPRDISLRLFRVAQEALHNALKYSGVKRFAVELGVRAKECSWWCATPGRVLTWKKRG